MTTDVAWLTDHIRDIPDWPKPGVVFKDITPLLGHPVAFRRVIDELAAPFAGEQIDKVLGVEARGFVVAAPLADRFGAGFVPVRKAGKLPWRIEREEYELEYGTDLLEIHSDAVLPGERVLIADDVLATGGTAAATVRLAERLGGNVVACSFLIELGFLDGRNRLPDCVVRSLVTYPGDPTP
ncbi:MAG: adenine phosphoribosyltransferase [Acidimicrobiia bacterium]